MKLKFTYIIIFGLYGIIIAFLLSPIVKGFIDIFLLVFIAGMLEGPELSCHVIYPPIIIMVLSIVTGAFVGDSRYIKEIKNARKHVILAFFIFLTFTLVIFYFANYRISQIRSMYYRSNVQKTDDWHRISEVEIKNTSAKGFDIFAYTSGGKPGNYEERLIISSSSGLFNKYLSDKVILDKNEYIWKNSIKLSDIVDSYIYSQLSDRFNIVQQKRINFSFSLKFNLSSQENYSSNELIRLFLKFVPVDYWLSILSKKYSSRYVGLLNKKDISFSSCLGYVKYNIEFINNELIITSPEPIEAAYWFP